MPETTSTNDQTYQIKEKLATLEAALLASSPEMPVILRDIHRHLKKDSELVTLLSEQECAVLVSGLKKQTQTSIATTAIKKGSKKAMSKLTLADL